MIERPTVLERAFSLAASGKVNSVAEIRMALRTEGYSDEGHFQGPALNKQLMKLIASTSRDTTNNKSY
jgi:hypothetical protein